jgi:carboxypeptidase family protein/TonB-dependent receptor-like protein
MLRGLYRPNGHIVVSLVLVAVITIFCAGQAQAQVAGATLSGTVKDASGSAIPGAQVSVRNVATGTVREFTSDAAGFYSVPNLLPGNYEVTFSAQGFSTQVSSGITLTVGAQQVLNVTMTVGQVSQKVVVTTEAPIVELASSTISGEVSATTVRELPLNGRSWTDLAALSPGVDRITTQTDFSAGSDRGNRGFGQQLTISGARPQQNNYRLDGVSLNDYSNGGPGSVLGGNLGVDAIQEFSVLTSNYSAEYGKTSGGVVNAVSRSGTNAFHGSAYEFFRNSKLDAANFFENANGLPRSPFKRNQFGGAIGGPIRKDRTFFFADYEGIRQSKGVPTPDSVPSDAARHGIVFDSNGNLEDQHACIFQGWTSANGCPTTGAPVVPLTLQSQCPTGATLLKANQAGFCVDNGVTKFVNAFYPLPNAGVAGNVGTFAFSGQQVVNENFITTRIDHKFSEKDSLFGTYFFDRTPYSAPDGYNNVELGHLTTRQFVSLEETHAFKPSFVNSARFGYNRAYVNDNQSLRGLIPAATDPQFGSFSNRNAAFVHVGGLTDMPGGVNGLPTYYYRWNSFQAYDDAFFTHGTHSIKFGVAVERMQAQSIGDSDPNGVWKFNSVPEFFGNFPTQFQGGIHALLKPRNQRVTLVGAYMQDDWRVRPSLTLNLGLRYEMTTIPTETSGRFINLRNLGDQYPVCGTVITNPDGSQGCSGPGPIFLTNPTLHNFEPRVGFAWDALHNGRLAVRGGAGMFDVLPLPYQITLMETQASPFFNYTSLGSSSFTNPNAFPMAGLPSPLPSNKLRSSYFDSHPKRDYVMQWNLSAQYQLTPNLAAMVAYVGSRGVHLPYRVDDANYALPASTPLGYVWVPKGGGTQINQFFSSVHGMFYQSRSYYNAFEAQISKRMSRGFQVQGVFTWAKSMDTNSATVAGDTFQNSISSLDWFDVRLTRSLSDFNVPRTFVLSGTWDAPSPKSLSGFARWPLDGWELGLIFTVSDGVPFTATWGGGNDPASTLGSDGFAYPNRSTSADCKSLVNPGNPNNYIKTQCFPFPTVPDQATFMSFPGLGYGCDTAFGQSTSSSQPNYLRCANLRGNAGRNILPGPALTNLDFSVYKNNYIKRISENFNVQFRAEMFNIMNHPNFGPPTPGDGNTDIFQGDGTANPIVGSLLRTVTPERQIQFALKVIF